MLIRPLHFLRIIGKDQQTNRLANKINIYPFPELICAGPVERSAKIASIFPVSANKERKSLLVSRVHRTEETIDSMWSTLLRSIDRCPQLMLLTPRDLLFLHTNDKNSAFWPLFLKVVNTFKQCRDVITSVWIRVLELVSDLMTFYMTADEMSQFCIDNTAGDAFLSQPIEFKSSYLIHFHQLRQMF